MKRVLEKSKIQHWWNEKAGQIWGARRVQGRHVVLELSHSVENEADEFGHHPNVHFLLK